MDNKKVAISGIQPTNNITLGNYLGAIKNFIQYQQEYEMYVFIADLHAITTGLDKDLHNKKIEVAKVMLACGLDYKKVTFFYQSDVLEHAMLGYILMCNTTIGELNRMTQFKDKASKMKQANGTDFIPTGLLTYPALMAADILLYDADDVLVGQDQKQHLELARNIAERMNNKFNSNLFKVPEFITPKVGSKIMDLQNPSIKMSKSNSNQKGTIFLNEDIESIRKKIMQALTDNLNQVKYDEINQPGISNLINIYSAITNKSIEEIEKEFKDIENYGVFKKAVAETVCNLIKSIQDNLNSFSEKKVNEIMLDGANKAKKVASEKLLDIYRKINF